MSALPFQQFDIRGGGVDEPLYFPSGGRQLFGWLHASNGGSSARMGIVICKPFGYEALCGHRSVRAFAEATAALDLPTLRFDYSGTGDSADIDPHASQLDIWTGDIVAAVDELRRRTGVEGVCLIGFRLGALLATLAATRCKAVSAVILVAPIVDGKRYARELRTTWLAASLGGDPRESTGTASANAQPAEQGSMEVSGYILAAATIASLTRVDLTALDAPPAAEMLVIDRSDLPLARAWAGQLAALGARVRYEALPGFVEMMLTAPQFATVPKPMVATACEWLLQCGKTPAERAGVAGCPYSVPGYAAPATTALSIPVDAAAPDSELTEHPLRFGPDSLLFGVITEPRRHELRRRGVILLNAGADYHIGASRMNVSLARGWARRGYFVLRMDLAGLGDSGTRPGAVDNEVFPPLALDDVRAAIDLLRTRWGIRDVTLAGLCSGAYHALRAAAAGLPVNRILMVNPQNFYWKPGMTLEGLQLAEVVRNPGVYRERILSTHAWRRVLSGQVNIWRIVKIYCRRPILALESKLRDFARFLHVHLPDDLGWELKQIGARGVRIVFVFARGEPGLELLRIQGGSSIKHLGELCRVHVIDSADHTFSRSRPRTALAETLSDELFAYHAGGVPAR